MLDKKRGMNLLELIVAMVLMSLVLLGFFSIELFSSHHVVTSDRRAKLQNEISYSLEYMAKYVQQGVGDFNNPPITRYPTSGTQTGFRVRVDMNNPPTPNNLTDDTWVVFYLSGNELRTFQGVGSSEALSSRICSNFVNDKMPQFPNAGFYVDITDNGAVVDVGLMGRYYPAQSVSMENPQTAMKTCLVVNSASAQ